MMLRLLLKKPLLLSSIFMCVFNIPSVIVSKTNLKYVCLSGLISSVVNHSCSNENPRKVYVRYFDRFVMSTGVSIYIYNIQSIEQLKMMYISIMFYFSARVSKITFLHVLAHVTVTIFHNQIIL